MDDLRAVPPSLTGLTTYLLSRTGKSARGRLAGRFAERGLRLWHHAVLAALADFGPHVQRDLAARLGIDPSDMAKIVDELAGAGYIERARDTADRRRITVTLTDAGRALLAELDADAEAVQDEILDPLTGDEREHLNALLRKVFTHLEN
ncbi:winged helix-turn-helix transcriptional regulator [Catenulispora sp. NF23]|uniref:MarR family winged helix-turn-helix transcriptional regulator n=1 Tax=Catenulispora pinistramenti TaxID=2705254 RepID=UPI001BAB3799|nr:MarR family winged helix-turn-helix transcriptional regulator [Catenulispora pinistramenti]MBS2535765.1 winged helix-turn-helix transcriptional regulator [Catenulispora pinistramenti]